MIIEYFKYFKLN